MFQNSLEKTGGGGGGGSKFLKFPFACSRIKNVTLFVLRFQDRNIFPMTIGEVSHKTCSYPIRIVQTTCQTVYWNGRGQNCSFKREK